ncbi:hypothetical protein SEVIR_6G161600v4 [Setaria viridis]|uniref:Uncharacterized protein n=1 Tax=Setaria viridis TaxID=4556 RepID=A0A4U6U5Y9_SETVI|nr:hypothetical protein SEVIR_6G161600v2 [Setaria viridis]
MLSPRGSHGAHPLPAGGRCSRRGYCCPYCWPSGTTILYPRIWVGIYSVDGCGFTINPQHHPLPPSSQVAKLEQERENLKMMFRLYGSHSSH